MRFSSLALLVPIFGLGLGGYALLRPTAVTVSPVVRGRAIEAVYATGSVECEQRVRVKAKVGGSLRDLTLSPGSAVEAGALLARIDDPSAGFELERARVELWAAKRQASSDAPRLLALKNRQASVEAELGVARQDRARLRSLFDAGTVAPAELDRIEGRVATLEGTLSSFLAEERALDIDLSANRGQKAALVSTFATRLADTEVRAPITGVVLEKHVEPGEVVAPNQLLFTLGDASRLLLEVDIDEADVARVSDGSDGRPPTRAAVSLDAFPGRVFKGTVRQVYADANRQKKAFLAKVMLADAPTGLRSGMSAELNLVVGEQANALLAPASGIKDGFAWVVRDGRARRVPVGVGTHDLLRVQITSGLKDGDRVVSSDAGGLTDGERVVVTERPLERNAPEPDAAQPLRTSL